VIQKRKQPKGKAMLKKRSIAAMALAGGLFVASVPTAAHAATVNLGSVTCGQSWGPYAHIRSDTSGSGLQHVHRQSATVFNTLTYNNSVRTVRITSVNYRSEDSSYLYLSQYATYYGSALYCDT
jgi:hypothetical protein